MKITKEGRRRWHPSKGPRRAWIKARYYRHRRNTFGTIAALAGTAALVLPFVTSVWIGGFVVTGFVSMGLAFVMVGCLDTAASAAAKLRRDS